METPNILIVEDSEVSMKLLKLHIENAFKDSLRIMTATSLKEVKSILLKTSVDLVITELHLSDSHGYDTVLSMQNLTSVTIIVVTNDSDDKTKIWSLMSGVSNYVMKDSDINWTTLILNTLDSNRKNKGDLSSFSKRIESLTAAVESLVQQIVEVNEAVFGGKSQDKESLIQQLISIKKELKFNTQTTQTINKLFWISVPIIITAIISMSIWAAFGWHP